VAGAVIGAVVGAGIAAYSTWGDGGPDWGAVGAGALGGALIGSGLGAVAAEAAIAVGYVMSAAGMEAGVGVTAAGMAGAGYVASAVTSVETPQGTRVQANTPEAWEARMEAEDGGTLYRIGRYGVSNSTNPPYWSLDNPAAVTEAFAASQGTFLAGSPDYILEGEWNGTSAMITRYSGAGPDGGGGALEAVVAPGGADTTGVYPLN
jgi:hypothetical protein